MNMEYECIPFGVVILKGNSLEIEYINSRARRLLELKEMISVDFFAQFPVLKPYNPVILDCLKQNNERRIIELELLQDRFFTVIILGKGNLVELYISETTEEVLHSRRKSEHNRVNLEKEREKFRSISTELKAKCDIIEILRDREKEHLMHLKDVINNISEGLIVIDNKGKFSLCNRAAYRITQLNVGELLNPAAILAKYSIADAETGNSDLGFLRDCIFITHTAIKSNVMRFTEKSSNITKYIELSSNPIFSLEKELIYTIVTIKDVTEAKIHQIYAEEQARFVKDVVNNLDVPIAIIDYPGLTYKLINRKHKEMSPHLRNIDLRIDDLVGRSAEEVLENNSGENLYSIMKSVGESGKEYSLSPYTVTDAEGNERLYKFKFSPYRDSKGEVTRIHVHGLDITDELNHSRELEKITRLKDEFFTVISHELRTPLTIIYSSLQLANDIYKDEITHNIDKTLARISQNCSRLLKLINNILDVSKAEAGFLTINNSCFDIVNLTESIVGSVNLYAKSKGIELVFDTNEEESLVCMDKDKYEKILLNLLSNSIKFTPEGKQIMVVLDIEEADVTLRVIDEGIGIPQSKINYIFDRFAQVNTSLSRRAEGTGIGLSLVKKLVEHMDGKISVASEEGKGSEFVVTYGRTYLQSEPQKEVATIDTTINYKIDIEFSDIN